MSDRKRLGGEKLLRILGYGLAAAGLVASTIVLAFRGGLSFFQIADGLAIPAVVPGIVLALFGCALAWVNRLDRADNSDTQRIDVRPITEWVRAFERHQADLEFHRLSELYHGPSLIKYEPSSSGDPGSSSRKSAA
jgi:hypothetical protein